MAAGKKKKALAASKANAIASVLEGQSRFGSEALTSRESPQLPVSKRKAEEFSSSDGISEPANRRPAPRPASQVFTGELAAEGSCQLGPAEGGLAYAAVVAGRAGSSSGSHKPLAKGSVHSEPAALSEAATRHMSLGYMSGPLCGKPDGTSSKAQMVLNSVFPTGERQYKIPIYISGVTDTRGALTSIRVSCHSWLSAHTYNLSVALFLGVSTHR